MKTQVPDDSNETAPALVDIYEEPVAASSYDQDPGHLRKAPWQAHVDARYGQLTQDFTNFRASSEVDRRTIGQLFQTPTYNSHAAQLAVGQAKTASPTLSERVRLLCGRR